MKLFCSFAVPTAALSVVALSPRLGITVFFASALPQHFIHDVTSLHQDGIGSSKSLLPHHLQSQHLSHPISLTPQRQSFSWWTSQFIQIVCFAISLGLDDRLVINETASCVALVIRLPKTLSLGPISWSSTDPTRPG